MQRHQVVVACQVFELHQQALLHIATHRGDGHEVRFVRHDQVLVFKHDAGLLRQHRLVGDVAVVVELGVRCVHLCGLDGLGIFVEHQVMGKAMQPFVPRDIGHAL